MLKEEGTQTQPSINLLGIITVWTLQKHAWLSQRWSLMRPVAWWLDGFTAPHSVWQRRSRDEGCWHLHCRPTEAHCDAVGVPHGDNILSCWIFHFVFKSAKRSMNHLGHTLILKKGKLSLWSSCAVNMALSIISLFMLLLECSVFRITEIVCMTEWQ